MIQNYMVPMLKNQTRSFSKGIGIEFGTEKCAMLVTEKGKIVKSVGIELLDGKIIRSGKIISTGR